MNSKKYFLIMTFLLFIPIAFSSNYDVRNHVANLSFTNFVKDGSPAINYSHDKSLSTILSGDVANYNLNDTDWIFIYKFNRTFGTIHQFNLSFINNETQYKMQNPKYFDILLKDVSDGQFKSIGNNIADTQYAKIAQQSCGNVPASDFYTSYFSSITQPTYLWNETKLVMTNALLSETNCSPAATSFNVGITEFLIIASDGINEYPNISSFTCSALNSTLSSYNCTAVASDAENDTIYYAIACEENTKKYFDYYPQNNPKYLNFDEYNVSVFGNNDDMYNFGSTCNFTDTFIEETGMRGWRFNNSYCKSSDNNERYDSVGVYLRDYTKYPVDYTNFLISKYWHRSDVYLDNGSSIYIDYKESSLNPDVSTLKLLVSRLDSLYYINYSINKSGFVSSFQLNVSASWISVRNYFDYYSDTFKTEIYSPTNDLLKTNTYTLGQGGNDYGYNWVVKYYVNNQSQAYLMRSSAYIINLPSYSLDNTRYCYFYANETVKATAYVTDNIHGFNDYSNYLDYHHNVSPIYLNTKVAGSIGAEIENLMGKYSDTIKLYILISIIGVLMFFVYQRTRSGHDIKSSTNIALFCFIIISIPLMYLNLIYLWIVIVDALIVAYAISSYFAFDSGGEK